MDSLDSPDVVSVPTPGHWSAQRVGWRTWHIVSDDERHIAVVQNDGDREHVQANALQMAASGQMLTALKAVDTHLIAMALNTAKTRGYDVTWEQVEVMFGVSDLHAEVRLAIAAAEGGR